MSTQDTPDFGQECLPLSHHMDGVGDHYEVDLAVGERELLGVTDAQMHRSDAIRPPFLQISNDPPARAEFSSGDVDLDLTGGAGNATLEVETYSGDLETGCSMTLQPGGRGDRMGKRGTLTMGNGGGAHFVLKTFSGDVHIRGCRSHGDR